MRKAHRSGPDRPGSRSRSDSFVRMLELEKMCKMKRAQHEDHGSSTSTSNPPKASLPSVTTNPPIPRSRRTSDYPPLSHQTQIMKAVRRSVALPSLSLFVPPSPTKAMTMAPKGSATEISHQKEEHAKIVTFSEPEDEELSDDSSICQSPSWEQYTQKKKSKQKKSKSDPNQTATGTKEDTSAKRRSNRLIKPAPTDQLTTRPTTISDRSISAPELGTSAQSNGVSSRSSIAEGQPASEMQSTTGNESGSAPKDKPKSRGFLSGFRRQSANVAAVRELAGARMRTTNTSAQADESLRSIQYETIPAQQSNAVRPGTDQNVTNSRTASIRSIVSISDRSRSSQDKAGSGVQGLANGGHSRSQSLLTSTLNKLKGPSYLYYQPSADSSAHNSPKYAKSPLGLDVPDNGIGMVLTNDDQTDLEHSEQPFDFAFDIKRNALNTEPGPEVAPRARQHRPRKIEIQATDAGQDVPSLRPSGGRRVKIDVPQLSPQEAVMALVTEQERQSKTARNSQQYNPNIAKSGYVLQPTAASEIEGKDVGKKPASSPIQNPQAIRVREAYVRPSNISRAKQSNETNGGDIHEPSRQNGRKADDKATIPRMGGTSVEQAAERSVDDLITFEKDAPDTLQQPLHPQREVDYFASFSDSYLPPALDLMPLNTGYPSHSRFPFPDEGSDEDNGHVVVHDRSQSDHPERTTAVKHGAQKAFNTIDPQPRENHRMEMTNTSAIHSQQNDPSRTTSERSSSSTCGDLPPSPATTPDSSRPQSRKGATASQIEPPNDVSLEESEQGIRQRQARPSPPRAQSALDTYSSTKPASAPFKPHRLHLKPKDGSSSASLPSSPPVDPTAEAMPRKSALKMPRNASANDIDSSTAATAGAAYLQEARKAAPAASAPSSRALRPHFAQKQSSGSSGSVVSPGNRAEPLAKMLVECCNCHFFHDMPSRVYECMAKPDSMVEDKLLGVSAAINTMVRCPWCAHGMTTQCCSGYAAVVYLKEKLHGR